MNAEADPIRDERHLREKNLYHDFLRLNYRILTRYEQIHEIFLYSLNNAITADERAHEQRKLEEINVVIARLRNVILSAEKNNETKLYSD
ncbi:Protein CBG14968 [Caenorhabditis briggsae]|uniref:Uncharacterized protein n=3 Tax=Caenorhabditis TaxID=6237 RepID=A0AAE9DQT6_CAEBR|nr:Protein CBG14968 [Caenorhabditis briggsae]PIC55815.1 hypothetical protein B9Z55_000931 [Caenorhabditis nigoni]ULU10130.1 hypothetical protein L3Y34_014449 [Caenorhabditis briggsae]UMM11060.1 hypothetical protein L5515_000530 [Caenorhabditis briggsae]CAP33368.2 Protein CBG14968 [Caenorhabditis briggsae]